MIKKLLIVITTTLIVNVLFAQVSTGEELYNGFTSRSFMKYNRFLTVPTYSLLREDKMGVSAVVRSTNVEFEDAPRLFLISSSGRLEENVGLGGAVYQQQVGVFKDFGFIGNYIYKVQVGSENDLAFGFNFAYGRRTAVDYKVLTDVTDPTLSNFQDISVITLQPAITMSFGSIDVGVFLENIVDYNLNAGGMATEFADKTFSGHVGYSKVFENAGGMFENANLRVLGIARKQPDGFGYGANLILDLPRVGWVKGAYDKTYGFQAGLGVNLSERIGLGFTYEMGDLGTTNEVGLTYTFGTIKKRRTYSRPKTKNKKKDKTTTKASTKTPDKVEQKQEEDKNTEQPKDLTNELKRAQDSINTLHKKVDEILKLLNNQPRQVIDTVKVKQAEATPVIPTVPEETTPVEQPQEQVAQEEEKDTSLKRSKATPWREKFVEVSDDASGGSGGTMYYVALDQFKDVKLAKEKLKKYKKRGVEAKYVRDPKTKFYYIYIDKFGKPKDADKIVKQINGGRGGSKFENGKANDLGIKIKSVKKDPVYTVKITFKGGETYKEPKIQRPAKVYPTNVQGVQSGYYLRVSVNGSKALADKFVDELRADNIKADYYKDPSTGYRHVYIYKTQSKEDAIRKYNNNLNNTYYDEKRIIYIK